PPHAARPPSYTPSLHDALPIFQRFVDVEPVSLAGRDEDTGPRTERMVLALELEPPATGDDIHHLLRAFAAGDFRSAGGVTYDALDRKSTRLNSSHVAISYAVFC